MDAVAARGAGEVIRIGQIDIRYLIDGSAAGGMGVFELGVAPNATVPPPHSHSNNDECVYVLEGTLRYSVDDVTRDLGPGDWMFTPRSAVHHFSNPHDKPARDVRCCMPDIEAARERRADARSRRRACIAPYNGERDAHSPVQR